MTVESGMYMRDASHWRKMGSRNVTPPPPPPEESEVTHTPLTWTATESKITFSTVTSEPTFRSIDYGLTSDLGTTDTYELPAARQDHNATFPASTNLPAATDVWFRATFTTSDGRSVTSPLVQARTAGTSTPPPPPTGSTVFTPDRSMYPSGSGAYSHLPPWQQWPKLYLLPPGSTYQAPAGVRVVRGSFLALNRDEHYLIYAPEPFINVTRGVRIQGGSYIIFGLQVENTKWIGAPGTENLAWYASDAEGGFRLPGPRPGRTRVDSSTRVTPNDENRGIYLTGHGSSGARTFRALEGTWLKGDWIFEGMDIAFQGENTSTEFVVNGFRHDRVSVAYTANSGKSGGDAFQVFDHGGGGHPDKLWIRGMTVGATSIQGFFTRPGSGRYTVFDAEDVVIRGSTKWGISAEMWWNTMPITTKRYVNVHVVPSPGRNKGNSIEPESSWPNISTTDISDTAPANEMGLSYAFKP